MLPQTLQGSQQGDDKPLFSLLLLRVASHVEDLSLQVYNRVKTSAPSRHFHDIFLYLNFHKSVNVEQGNAIEYLYEKRCSQKHNRKSVSSRKKKLTERKLEKAAHHCHCNHQPEKHSK